MKKFIFFGLMFLFLLPLSTMAEVYEARPGLKVVLPPLPEPWIVSREASPALVAHLAEHLKEDAEKQGRTVTEEQVLSAARQRLASNELMIFNEKSEAHLLISFSPIGEKEKDPNAKSVAISAQYAAEGVTDEGWTDVQDRHEPIAIKGAMHAQWFEINYKEDGASHLFMGVVGYARPYWFWLYANDHLKDPGDRAVLENILRNIEIRVEP
ncbi:hypothetical protein [Geoalkalibacter sp.]|uniref:hypothetical protein n=1 Tax=Geoalkalibacter sp. TaxID=3041440 RepID=UPI00272E50DC|nr:hypothetical protein [Geoalkalibacter sp.]